MDNLKTKDHDFMELYNPVHARFERFCKARVYGDMFYKDLMHDSILIAYEKIDTLKNRGAFLHFLFGIAIRVLANANRKNRPEPIKENGRILFIEDEANRADKNDDLDMLYQGLAKLSEEQREALILFEISGFSIAEIAELQKASVSAIKQRLLRGRKELLAVLREREEPLAVTGQAGKNKIGL
jgi:RNA polymerase sigma factor (sigma-70 family)